MCILLIVLSKSYINLFLITRTLFFKFHVQESQLSITDSLKGILSMELALGVNNLRALLPYISNSITLVSFRNIIPLFCSVGLCEYYNAERFFHN